MKGVYDTKYPTLLDDFEGFYTVVTRFVEITRDLELETKHNYVLKCCNLDIKQMDDYLFLEIIKLNRFSEIESLSSESATKTVEKTSHL